MTIFLGGGLPGNSGFLPIMSLPHPLKWPHHRTADHDLAGGSSPPTRLLSHILIISVLLFSCNLEVAEFGTYCWICLLLLQRVTSEHCYCYLKPPSGLGESCLCREERTKERDSEAWFQFPKFCPKVKLVTE